MIWKVLIGGMEKRLETGIPCASRQLTRTERRIDVLNWLYCEEISIKQDSLRRDRAQNSGAWFIISVEFRRWLEDGHNILFCPGIGSIHILTYTKGASGGRKVHFDVVVLQVPSNSAGRLR